MRNQVFAVSVERLDVGKLCGEVVVNKNFSSSSLVDGLNHSSIAKSSLSFHRDVSHIFNHDMGADAVISDVVFNIGDKGVIPNGTVVQVCVVDPIGSYHSAKGGVFS